MPKFDIEHKNFHDGGFQSVGLVVDGRKRYTVGIMVPGYYEFPARLGSEHITITSGSAEINGKPYHQGETAFAEANSTVIIRAEEPCSYICVFE